MEHAQKPDFVFRGNGRVHLNRRGRQFSRLLAAEVCASAVVMLDTPCSEVVWRVLATHSIRQFPLHFLSLRHRVSSHFNWSLKHVKYYLCNKQQALTIFRVPHQKWYKRTLGDIIPILRTFLVFTRLDVLLEVLTKINSGGMLCPFDWQTLIDLNVPCIYPKWLFSTVH